MGEKEIKRTFALQGSAFREKLTSHARNTKKEVLPRMTGFSEEEELKVTKTDQRSNFSVRKIECLRFKVIKPGMMLINEKM